MTGEGITAEWGKVLNGVGKKERPKKKKTKAGEKNCLQNGKLCYNVTMEPMVARL